MLPHHNNFNEEIFEDKLLDYNSRINTLSKDDLKTYLIGLNLL